MNKKKLVKISVAILIALSVFVSFVPSALAQGAVISIGSGSADPGENVTVPVMVNNVTNVGVVDINITFDPTVVDVEVEQMWIGPPVNKWFIVGDFDNTIPVIENTKGFARIGAFQSGSPGLNGNVRLVNLKLTPVDSAGSYTTLNITVNELKDATPEGSDIQVRMQNGTFTITGERDKLIVSCDATGKEQNVFIPGEDVYVRGKGLSERSEYRIWIQEEPVNESKPALIPEEDPSYDPSKADSLELVATDENGDFVPTLIWNISLDAPVTHEQWDIVVDKQGDPYTGIYNEDSDGIDSATTFGITAPVPELTTMTLISVGLIGIVGYSRYAKKRE